MTLRTLLRLAVATVAVLGTLVVGAPANAFPNSFYPTQSLHNRGVDVLAVQHLLQQHGQSAPTDGVFGQSTDRAVRAFQTAKGLGVDGIVGPNTWAALVVTVREGSSGAAVRALQVQLNEKNRARLGVNGTFDAATRTAVTAFQRHAGIGADGIAGPNTWRNLLWHYAYPDMAAGFCDKDPDNNGTVNWGTGATIGQLEEAGRRFASQGRGQIPLGDVSKEHGGPLNGHASHQVGMDVDLWPVRKDAKQCSAARITWRSAEYDRAATRELVKAIRASAPGHVKLVFFNDPVLIDEGLVTHWANHDNHLHVRYCEKVHPNSLYAC